MDRRADSSNILTQEEGPERELVTPHLEKLSEYRASFQAVLGKMVSIFLSSLWAMGLLQVGSH